MSGMAIGIVDTDVGPLIAPIDPWIWPDLVKHGVWEPMVGEVVRSVLEWGGTVINVGAHVGYYTRMASLAVGSDGTVHAYEPAPSNRKLLGLNTADRKNVVIHDEAVGDESGRAVLNLSSVNPGDHHIGDHPDGQGSVSVLTVRLDDEHYRTPPRLIFVDAQGYDLKVLRGARRLIDDAKPHVMIEWTPCDLDHADYPEIDRLLDLGYTASIVEGPDIKIERAIDGDVIGQGTGTLHLAPPT